MPNRKKLIDFFQNEGLLFPETEEEVEKFEKSHIDYNEEQEPMDWDAPNQIIKRGRQKLKSFKPETDNSIKSEIQDLKMVARKGNELSEDIIKKMKENQRKNEKGE